MVVARFLIPGGLSALLITGLLIAVPFSSGWEVANSLEALTVSDQPGLTYFNDCKAYDALGNQVRPFAGIGPPAPDQLPLSECSTGSSNWRIDVDAQFSGRPSLFIETSPVRHTNFQGIQTDNGLAVESRQVTRQRDTYFLDYHVFLFDFRVRTVADVKATSCIRNVLLQEICVFDHETSATIGCFPTLATICGTNGKLFDGSSLVAFFINPWQGARTAPEGTIRFGQWAGIMQAIIFEAEAGFDTAVPQDSPGSATAVLGKNAAANMFKITGGESLPNFQFGTASLDDDIPQLVLVELPYRLLPGADWTIAPGSGFSALVPSNVNVHYIVRMDVLLVTGWQPQLDYVDANSNGIRDFGEFTFIDRNENNRWDPSTDEAVEGTPPAVQTTALESPAIQPEDPPQTGSQLQELGPIPDVTVPAPCEFWNLSCWFNTAINFPTVSSIVGLLTVLILIVVIVFGVSLFIGRRGR